MPIPILSIPVADLQYAINCMETCDFIAFSLCSKRTKKLAKYSNRKIDPVSVEVYDNSIRFEILSWTLYPPIIFLAFSDSRIKLDRGNGIKFWKKQQFTQSEWIAHFLSIFTEPIIHQLVISDVCPISYLDTVKQIIPKCRTLRIMKDCSTELTRTAVSKLSYISEKVEINYDRFDNQNHISEFLTMNLKMLSLESWRTPFKVELNDLLLANSVYLTISTAIITDRELNRFLRLWMKSNHKFYRPKYIKLFLKKEIIHEELLRGIKNHIFGHERRLTRGDGKELLLSIRWKTVVFEFQ
ncbi:unnamed protein product [Caenorhabditis nigoni]